MTQPLTTEYRRESTVGVAEVEMREHAVFSSAKKVVQLSEALQLDAGLDTYTRNAAPSHNAAFSAAIAFTSLKSKSVYRYIASVASHILLKKVASASSVATTDFYIPANTPYFFQTDTLWTSLEAIPTSTSGFAQVTPVR